MSEHFRPRAFRLLPLAVLLTLQLAACTAPETIEPAVTTSSRAPITLAVNQVRQAMEAPPPASGNFKDRRRSARLGEATKDFLGRRLLAGGGEGGLDAVVTEAILIERPRATTGGFKGFFIKEPDADLDASIAVRLSITDGTGLERAFAEIKVARTRAVTEGLDVIERDALSEALIEDLLRQLDEKLTSTIDIEMPEYKAF
ncbi:MAG: hypothetical protein R3C97_03745 [Geminicoccaceae bacterium]